MKCKHIHSYTRIRVRANFTNACAKYESRAVVFGELSVEQFLMNESILLAKGKRTENN